MKKRFSLVLTLTFVLLCMMVPAMAATPETAPIADGLIMEDLSETHYKVQSVGIVQQPDTPEMMDGKSGFVHATREAVLVGEDGKKHTITLGKSVKNFDQIKVGDDVTIKSFLQTSIFVGKVGQVPGGGESKLIFSAPKGEKPASIEVEKTFITMVINKLDSVKKTITVTLPDNSKKTIATPNVSFDKLKVGEDVIVEIKKEVSVVVSAPVK